ncbi:unnamed protein product, partial [Allacma fusca]
MNAFIPRTDIY